MEGLERDWADGRLHAGEQRVDSQQVSIRDALGVDGMVERGVSVRFIKESQTFAPGTSSSMSRLLLGVLGSVAEFERALIHERQDEGIAAAKARGAYRGSQPRLTTEQIGQARNRVAQGVPVARVAREAGGSRQTLYDALSARNAYAPRASACP